MKTKIVLIGLIALFAGCLPAEIQEPYLKVSKVESDKKGISKYTLTGGGYKAFPLVSIEDVTGKYQVGDSLMFVLKTNTDSIK